MEKKAWARQILKINFYVGKEYKIEEFPNLVILIWESSASNIIYVSYRWVLGWEIGGNFCIRIFSVFLNRIIFMQSTARKMKVMREFKDDC